MVIPNCDLLKLLKFNPSRETYKSTFVNSVAVLLCSHLLFMFLYKIVALEFFPQEVQ